MRQRAATERGGVMPDRWWLTTNRGDLWVEINNRVEVPRDGGHGPLVFVGGPGPVPYGWGSREGHPSDRETVRALVADLARAGVLVLDVEAPRASGAA